MGNLLDSQGWKSFPKGVVPTRGGPLGGRPTGSLGGRPFPLVSHLWGFGGPGVALSSLPSQGYSTAGVYCGSFFVLRGGVLRGKTEGPRFLKKGAPFWGGGNFSNFGPVRKKTALEDQEFRARTL